jgi:uncharacterized protein (TIGR03066 family)
MTARVPVVARSGDFREPVPSLNKPERLIVKTRISLLIASFAFISVTALAGSAHAGVDRGKLVGVWSGDLVVWFHGQAKGMQVELTFKKNGKFSIKQLKSGKTDNAKYRIEGDKIVITDGKDKNTYMTDITLTDTKLKGRFEASAEGDQQHLSIELSLTRGAAAANKGKKAPDTKKAPDKKAPKQ